jgi:hypothetical protein
VNTPGDAHEREADRVADQVMRTKEGDAPIVQRMPLTLVASVQRKCIDCEKEEKEQVQRKETAGGNASGKTAPSIVSNVLSSSGGQPMDAGTRQFMESRFGQDFGQVRIHTGGQAAESAAAVQARAYTSGRDIVFGKEEYQPGSEGGKRLLAHELVHVGQQGSSNKLIQRRTREQALRFGQDLNRLYPNWLSILPACPCTYQLAMSMPGIWRDATGFWTSHYHPGADKDVRSVSGYSSSTGSYHGQQCTYDSDGNLITEGAGAGTPDIWAPNDGWFGRNTSRHQSDDVEPFSLLGWRLYTQFWRPNKGGNQCPANAGGRRRDPDIVIPPATQQKIVRIQNQLDGFFHSEEQIQIIIQILRDVTSSSEMGIIRRVISPMLTQLLDIGDRTRIRVELSRI